MNPITALIYFNKLSETYADAQICAIAQICASVYHFTPFGRETNLFSGRKCPWILRQQDHTFTPTNE